MHGNKLNQEAVNRYSQAFSSIILDDFFSKQDGINGQQIITITPIKQINFFVLKVLFDQWQEETKKFKSPFFNYRNAEVNGALKNLVNTLSKNILIEKEDFRGLLASAVEETIMLVFDPENYYLNQANTLAATKNIRSVSKYIKVYKPLFDGIALAAEKAPEKDLNNVISEVISVHEMDTNEQKEIIASFNSVLDLDGIASEAHPVIEIDTPQERTMPEISVTEAFGQPSPENINGHDAPLDEEIKNEFEPLNPNEHSPDATNINDQFGNMDIRTLNQKYEKQEVQETIATKHESQTVSDLAASININQRYMFLNDLFDGDEKDYNMALDTVDKNESFDESVGFLVQNYSKKYSWDMNSDEIKEFLKVIFKRFR